LFIHSIEFDDICGLFLFAFDLLNNVMLRIVSAVGAGDVAATAASPSKKKIG